MTLNNKGSFTIGYIFAIIILGVIGVGFGLHNEAKVEKRGEATISQMMKSESPWTKKNISYMVKYLDRHPEIRLDRIICPKKAVYPVSNPNHDLCEIESQVEKHSDKEWKLVMKKRVKVITRKRK